MLGRSLTGLLPQTRAVLDQIDAYVQRQADESQIERDAVRFQRRQLRDHTGLSDARLKVHLRRLVDWEILSCYRIAGGAFEYALHYSASDRKRDVVHLNLLDVGLFGYDDAGKRIASEDGRIAPGSGVDRGRIGGGSPRETNETPVKDGALVQSGALTLPNRPCGGTEKTADSTGSSYKDGAA